MILRALLYLAVVAAVSVGAAWFAQTPGAVTIDWRGWRIDTSLGVLAGAVLILAVVTALLYRLWRALRRTPGSFGRVRRDRRRGRGYQALSRGLVAVAAGDPEEARRQARLADSLLEDPPLTLLLSAQAAQIEGDEDAARAYFTRMLERPETAFLGLRGLLVQAERAGDDAAALALARRARKLRPKTHWVLTALFDKEAAAGNWGEAEAALKQAVKHKTMPAGEATRARAAVLLQRALAAEAEGEAAGALKFSRRANEADPDFLPATVDLTTRLVAAGRMRAAAAVIERAWPRAPHPELARLHGQAVRADDALRRLQALETLRARRPDHIESHLALARAALDARLWGEARRHLDAAAATLAATTMAAAGEPPPARLCRLRAEVEEAEHGNTEAARRWLAEAAEAPPDPGWVCDRCGAAAPAWNAICGHCGAFGKIDWRTPPRIAPALAPPPETTPDETTEPAAPTAIENAPPDAPTAPGPPAQSALPGR